MESFRRSFQAKGPHIKPVLWTLAITQLPSCVKSSLSKSLAGKYINIHTNNANSYFLRRSGFSVLDNFLTILTSFISFVCKYDQWYPSMYK